MGLLKAITETRCFKTCERFWGNLCIGREEFARKNLRNLLICTVSLQSVHALFSSLEYKIINSELKKNFKLRDDLHFFIAVLVI